MPRRTRAASVIPGARPPPPPMSDSAPRIESAPISFPQAVSLGSHSPSISSKIPVVYPFSTVKKGKQLDKKSVKRKRALLLKRSREENNTFLRVRSGDKCQHCFSLAYPCLLRRDATRTACEGCHNVPCVFPLYHLSTPLPHLNLFPTTSEAYILEEDQEDLDDCWEDVGTDSEELMQLSNRHWKEGESKDNEAAAAGRVNHFGRNMAVDLSRRLEQIAQMVRDELRGSLPPGSTEEGGSQISESSQKELLQKLDYIRAEFEERYMR